MHKDLGMRLPVKHVKRKLRTTEAKRSCLIFDCSKLICKKFPQKPLKQITTIGDKNSQTDSSGPGACSFQGGITTMTPA